MAQVKCQVTSEKGKSEEFYCVITNSKKKYYKSKEIYDQFIREQKQKELTVKYILELLGYQFSPYLLKKLKTLNSKYSYEAIFKTTQQNESKIKYFVSGKLADAKEVQKINYVFAIIDSNINDVQKAIEVEIKQNNNSSKIEIDIDDLNKIKHIPIKSKNISGFLEGEDI